MINTKGIILGLGLIAITLSITACNTVKGTFTGVGQDLDAVGNTFKPKHQQQQQQYKQKNKSNKYYNSQHSMDHNSSYGNRNTYNTQSSM